MVNVETGFVGALPRPYRLAKYINKYLSGKISKEKIEGYYLEFTKRAISKTVKIGLNYITDGMFRWDDIFNPLISFIDGVEVDGLVKFYENNFFYRTPRVIGEVKIRENPLKEWFLNAQAILKHLNINDKVVLKPVLPGPLTLTLHSINEKYDSESKLLHDYTFNVLLPLIRDFNEVGASIIELHEPALVALNVDKSLINEALDCIKALTVKGHVKIWLQTYFGPIDKVLPDILELKNIIVGVDVVDYPKSIDKIVEYEGFKELAVGVFDARNTLLESRKTILHTIHKLIDTSIDTIILTPNTTLDFLPENVAYRKLRRISSIARYIRKMLKGEKSG